MKGREGPPPGGPSSFGAPERVVERGGAAPDLGVAVAAGVDATVELEAGPARDLSRHAPAPFAAVGRLLKRRAVADKVGALQQPLVLDGNQQRDEDSTNGDDAEHAANSLRRVNRPVLRTA